MARAQKKVLLEIDPHSVVDDFHGQHERGERKFYTPDEADAMLTFEYGGRPVFSRVDEPSDLSKSEEP